MTPLEIACRVCAAQPWEPCHDDYWTWDNNLQKYVQPTLDKPHAERVFDAETWNSAEVAVDKKIIDQAAEEEI